MIRMMPNMNNNVIKSVENVEEYKKDLKTENYDILFMINETKFL